MKRFQAAACVLGLLAAVAAPAVASEGAAARDVQAAVDSYVATAGQDASLVGGPGSAGYDAGFWIRGGDFSLRINATLQARYEWWDWSEDADEAIPGGDLSGFSLPRATLKLSGTAPCNTRWYVELEFGHPGNDLFERRGDIIIIDEKPASSGGQQVIPLGAPLGPSFQSENYANTREAWIEWGCSAALNFRMGQIELPATRQLLTDPALQQFVDISLASAFVGNFLPGYTDRNREHGVMVHGAFGCENEFSWMLAVTNGDSGDSIRNIWDIRTDDNLAYSGRINWAFAKPTGYEEGALRQTTCDWYGEVGAWGFYHADRLDKPHAPFGFDWLLVGGDVQVGYGGLSMTAAFTWVDVESTAGAGFSFWSALAQVGFLFPDTAWEIAVRWSGVNIEPDTSGESFLTHEFAGAVNYYLNGHGNKLTLDVSYVMADSDGPSIYEDLYAGYHRISPDETGLLVRFQWQLAL